MSLQVAAKAEADRGAGTDGLERAAGMPRQYHLYRDIRSYGKYELLYNESRERGILYLRFPR